MTWAASNSSGWRPSNCDNNQPQLVALQNCVMLPVFVGGKAGKMLVWYLLPQKLVGRMGTRGALSPVLVRKKSRRCWMKVVAVEFLQTNQLAPIWDWTRCACSMKSNGPDFSLALLYWSHHKYVGIAQQQNWVLGLVLFHVHLGIWVTCPSSTLSNNPKPEIMNIQK